MRLKKSYVDISQVVKNNNGFTLLTSLIALSILITILPIMFYFTKPLADLSHLYDSNQLEIRQMDFLISFELNRSVEIRLTNNQLHFVRANGNIVTFEQYNDLIRRRSNHQGHEVIMFDVDHYSIEDLNDTAFKVHYIREGEQVEKVYTHHNIKSY
ncbi:competence type IV pilus minor pilin ComGF [Alkalibacillus silvisoli]|uniref:Competence protein ComGF n=1 Tax=Alkalibacillus silvisoli TaxID=392823 RepID=A0ABP3JLM6_9BACI